MLRSGAGNVSILLDLVEKQWSMGDFLYTWRVGKSVVLPRETSRYGDTMKINDIFDVIKATMVDTHVETMSL